MRHGQRGGASAISFVKALSFGIAGLWSLAYFTPTALAMHEVDHRFTVEGHVCGADGQPVPDTQVIAKDVRVSVNATGYTNSRGYYKATLHLHNDNRGDPIVVTALNQEQRVTAQFDAKDVHTERHVTVNFGSGCDASAGGPDWIYYGAGIGLAAVAAFAGVRLIRNRQRSRKRGKGQRK
ncbi:MAG: carboxypeptidase regulatory-like domain-containing protein [Nitrospirae bacterium]|nr:carboxypeptidase regulatory-like domain-containing protein [Nitrospirota bacterium]